MKVKLIFNLLLRLLVLPIVVLITPFCLGIDKHAGFIPFKWMDKPLNDIKPVKGILFIPSIIFVFLMFPHMCGMFSAGIYYLAWIGWLAKNNYEPEFAVFMFLWNLALPIYYAVARLMGYEDISEKSSYQ